MIQKKLNNHNSDKVNYLKKLLFDSSKEKIQLGVHQNQFRNTSLKDQVSLNSRIPACWHIMITSPIPLWYVSSKRSNNPQIPATSVKISSLQQTQCWNIKLPTDNHYSKNITIFVWTSQPLWQIYFSTYSKNKNKLLLQTIHFNCVDFILRNIDNNQLPHTYFKYKNVILKS